MEQTELITHLYKALLENQSLIDPPPELHVTAEQLAQNPDVDLMLRDLISLACSLLDVHTPDVDLMVTNLNAKYPNPTSFWRLLLTEVIGILAPDKRPRSDAVLLDQGKHILQQLNGYIADRNAVITACEKKIKDAHFPVDAHALLLNYINMACHHPEQAWEILTTTPAYFSPIITTDDNGKTIMSANKGKQWNAELAQFLKNLTV